MRRKRPYGCLPSATTDGADYSDFHSLPERSSVPLATAYKAAVDCYSTSGPIKILGCEQFAQSHRGRSYFGDVSVDFYFHNSSPYIGANRVKFQGYVAGFVAQAPAASLSPVAGAPLLICVFNATKVSNSSDRFKKNLAGTIIASHSRKQKHKKSG